MTEFTKEMFEDIKCVLEEYGVLEIEEDIRFYEGYSGRGMFGKTVNGLVISNYASVSPVSVGIAIGYLANEANETENTNRWDVDPFRLLSRRDSLGLGTILY